MHSSVGQIADLWDYIYPGKPESEAAGESRAGVYKLHFFYTERGASGSTCFMQFTLPSVSVIYENQYRDLIVSKEVAHETDTESAFEFEITIDDINRVRGDKIAYTIHDASGNVVPLPDTLNPDEDPTIQDSVTKRIKLKDDWYVRFKMISIGSAYQVKEIDPGTGFATEYQTFEFTDASLRRSVGYVASNLSSAAAGRDTGSGTIGNGSVDGYGVKFINHPLYKLEIRKDADYPQPDELFSFKVELKDADGRAFPDAVKVRYRSGSADWRQTGANQPIVGLVADGGVFTIDGLPYGTKYTITETGSSGKHGLSGYETTYQVDDGSAQSGTATGMLTANGDVSVLFENKAKFANLVIHKDATDEIPDEAFAFEVAIAGESRSDYSALTYDVRGADGQPVSGKDDVEVAVSDGVAALIRESITEDQYIVIEGIPYGSAYVVKETGDGLHRFAVSAEGKNGETVSDDGKTVTGTISTSADYTVTFKNVNKLARLELTKKTEDFGKGEFELLDAVFSLEHNAQVCCAADFEAPAYTGGSGESAKHVFEKVRVGHRYLLRETKSPVHHLIPRAGWTITVEATEDGRFTLRGVDEKGKTLAFDALDIAFGVYNEILYMPTHAEFEVGKLLDNLNPQDSDVFTFTLTQVKADYISTSGGDTIIDRAALDDPQWSMEASNVTTNASGNAVTGSKVVFSDGEHLRFEQKDMYVEGSDIYTSEFFYLIHEKATDQKVTIDETIYGVRLRMLPDTQKANGQNGAAIPLVQDEVYFVLGEDGKVAYLNGGLVPTYKNTSRVDIRLLKFDPGDVRLTGAEFALSHDPDCMDCSGASIPAIASQEISGGQYVMTDLLVGHDYLLTETKAPDYHLRPRDPWKLRVAATGNKQFELSIVGDAGNLRINQATATGENPTFEMEVHDPQRYPAITLKLGAKKLLDDLIPPQGKQYTFNLYAADEKPVQSESFSLSRYVGRAKLLERAKNVRGDIDFSTVLRYTHHDIHADHGGKEFYFLINETWPDEKGLVHDTSVFLITVRIHAAGGDAFTAGSLVPELKCHRIYPDGSMSRESAAAVQSMYENVSGKTLGVPTAVFRNNRMGDLPETGDESRMALYAVLLAVSVGALLALGFMRRRKQ